jgi:hypothetical protein
MRIALFLFLISSCAFADFQKSRKIIYKIKDYQSVVQVGVGGGVSKEAEIIWDEDTDGAIPIMPDYSIVSKSGKILIEDPVKKQAKQDKETLEQIKNNQKSSLKEELAILREKLETDTITATETRRLLKLYLNLKGE